MRFSCIKEYYAYNKKMDYNEYIVIFDICHFQPTKAITMSDVMSVEYNDMLSLITALYANATKLHRQPSNKVLQYQVNASVGDLVQFGILHTNDRCILDNILNILVEVYMSIIEHDFNTVQDVVDTLVMGRTIIRNAISDVS
jgi:hypothetical protein